jgi:hypothetical protein
MANLLGVFGRKRSAKRLIHVVKINDFFRIMIEAAHENAQNRQLSCHGRLIND